MKVQPRVGNSFYNGSLKRVMTRENNDSLSRSKSLWITAFALMSKSPIVGIIQSRSLDEDKTIRKVLKRGLKSETNCLASSYNRRVSSIGDSIDFDHSIHRMISNDICVKYRSDNVNTIIIFFFFCYKLLTIESKRTFRISRRKRSHGNGFVW